MSKNKRVTIQASNGDVKYPPVSGQHFAGALKYGYDGYQLDDLTITINLKTGDDAQSILDNMDNLRVFFEIHKTCLQKFSELERDYKVQKSGEFDNLTEKIREWANEMEQPRAVIPFGNTKYDSSILDHIYRAWESEDGYTYLYVYWNGSLLLFKTASPYVVIKYLIAMGDLGALCSNYDWEEVDTELDRHYSRSHCLDLVKNVPVKSLDELFSNAEKIREWLEGGE